MTNTNANYDDMRGIETGDEGNVGPKATKVLAWRPQIAPNTALITLLVAGLSFIPIGLALCSASNSVQESVTEYTQCTAASCSMDILLKEPFNGSVYFYYGLSNYFQNHRRYVKSRSDKQLLGNLHELGDCEPYDKMSTVSGVQIDIAPCGAIANSMFNDTFRLTYVDKSIMVPWTHEGVVWQIDKQQKFRNPKIRPGETLRDAFANTTKPPNWSKNIWELDITNPDNNGFLNTDFIVWMRTAALPNFRKLYRILVAKDEFAFGLPAGSYRLDIENNYPTKVFGGKKYFIISTTSWVGGKNWFLGVVYLVFGSLCTILGFISLLFYHKKNLSDVIYCGSTEPRTRESQGHTGPKNFRRI